MQTGHLDLGESELCDRLVYRGRILKHPDHYVWGCSPIYGPDGRVHVFYSRWPKESGWKGYILDSEIAHAVADSPEVPYAHADEPVVLDGRPGDSAWDSYSIHNPEVHRIGDRYALLYYGSSVYNRNEILGKIGLAFADSLDGSWERNPGNPVVERGERGDWDSVAVNTSRCSSIRTASSTSTTAPGPGATGTSGTTRSASRSPTTSRARTRNTRTVP